MAVAYALAEDRLRAPEELVRAVAVGIAFGIAFKLLMRAIVMPLLGAPEVNQAYHHLAGNSSALPAAIFTMLIVGGFGEETLYRGYLFERLGKLLGSGGQAKTLMLTAGFFAAGHYREQGIAGVEQAVFTGVVFGTIFAVTGEIWMVMGYACRV